MSILNQILKNDKIILSDLKPKRDYLYIKDFCSLIKVILEKKLENHIFNAGSGKNYSVREVVSIMQSLSGTNLPLECNNISRDNEILETKADISKAKKLLKWKPTWSFEEGIQEILDISDQ